MDSCAFSRQIRHPDRLHGAI